MDTEEAAAAERRQPQEVEREPGQANAARVQSQRKLDAAGAQVAAALAHAEGGG